MLSLIVRLSTFFLEFYFHILRNVFLFLDSNRCESKILVKKLQISYYVTFIFDNLFRYARLSYWKKLNFLKIFFQNKLNKVVFKKASR